jgi:hypothetical protein
MGRCTRDVETKEGVSGHLKVAEARLQGATSPSPEREERCPGDSVSDPAKTLFSYFSRIACGDARKIGGERQRSRLLNGPIVVLLMNCVRHLAVIL